jgi:hypothetical protein
MNAKTKVANCAVLGTDADQASHVSKSTPMNRKRQEIQESPQYQDGAINKSREQRTTRLRRGQNVKPI